MRHEIKVFMPESKSVSYSLYAYGVRKGNPVYYRDKKGVLLTFKEGTVVVLFYYFAGFRRAFVITGWESERDGLKYNLPGVEGNLYILYTAVGREFCSLKHTVDLITRFSRDRVFLLPVLFWLRLCALVRAKKARKTNIMHLLYKERMKEDKNGRKNDICSKNAV